MQHRRDTRPLRITSAVPFGEALDAAVAEKVAPLHRGGISYAPSRSCGIGRIPAAVLMDHDRAESATPWQWFGVQLGWTGERSMACSRRR